MYRLTDQICPVTHGWPRSIGSTSAARVQQVFVPWILQIRTLWTLAQLGSQKNGLFWTPGISKNHLAKKEHVIHNCTMWLLRNEDLNEDFNSKNQVLYEAGD